MIKLNDRVIGVIAALKGDEHVSSGKEPRGPGAEDVWDRRWVRVDEAEPRKDRREQGVTCGKGFQARVVQPPRNFWVAVLREGKHRR